MKTFEIRLLVYQTLKNISFCNVVIAHWSVIFELQHINKIDFE